LDSFTQPRNLNRILIAAILGAGLGFLGSSIVNVALPTFQTELGADATDIQWIVSAFNLAIAALLLSSGAFSDRFGHLVIFRLGLVIYAVSSVVCAAAWSPMVLIIGRALQGFSSALLIPSSLGLVNTAFPPEERGRAVGLWSSYSAVAGGVGPLIAGVLLAITSWRYLFWINVPMALLVWYLLGRTAVLGHETHSRQFDWHGAGYSIGTLGLLTFAAIKSSTLGIAHPVVLSLFGFAGIVAHQFLRRQKVAENPLIPLGIFRSRNFMAANIVTFLAYSSIGGGFYVMMLTWIQIQGYSPLAAGTITLPFMLFTAGFAHPVARLVRRIGARLPLSIGVTLLGIGFVIFSIPDVGTPFWLGYFPGIIVSAAGLALLVAPVTTVIMGSVDPSQSGIASGINSAIARSAILLSVAVLGAIHIAQFEQAAILGLAALDLPATLESTMHAELINMAAAEIPGNASPEVREAIHDVIVNAFMSAARIAILIAAALSLSGGLIAFYALTPLQRNE
jgi:EmrB/QacA subfamily drug resistance transporter